MNKKVYLIIALVLMLVVLSGCNQKNDEIAENTHVVETNYGKIDGVKEDGVVSYKGVPFAMPPLDELRFAPPQPPKPWDDILPCTEYKGAPEQAKQEESLKYSEDCLYLNIWKPEQKKEDPMPVLVFIHGGAFTQGSASKPLYNGTRFAQDGVVQVNLAYRLNALGFMPTPELEEEYKTTGNVGVLDQIAGLKWVKENIEAFGGDPDNITICGESAGSWSVSNMILSPMSEGLFKKAIMESGTVLGTPITSPLSNGSMEQAKENRARLMDALKVKNLEELRSVDAHEIAVESNFEMDMTNPSNKAFFPVFDGKILPKDPYAALNSGQYNKVDILAGYNTDEGTLFIKDGISEQVYTEFVERIFGDNAQKVLERYPVDKNNTPTDRARFIIKMGMRMGGDVFGNKLSSDGNKVYLYHFDHTIDKLEKMGLGTSHASELFFVFDNPSKDMNLSEKQKEYVEEVHNRWLNFIKNDDPNEGVSFDTTWEQYTPDKKRTMVLNESSHMEPAEQVDDVEFIMSMLWNS